MGARLPVIEKGKLVSAGRERAKLLAWSIFGLCAATSVLALWMLSGRIIGFVLAFGSALVAYESIVVARRISRSDSFETGATPVPGAKPRTVQT
jgi:hypothetical protein